VTASFTRSVYVSASPAPIIVFCTCPDEDTAETLASELVTAQLAACVNILPGIRSIYRWQGEVETAIETLMLIKTTRLCYEALEACIKGKHPYELPEIVWVGVGGGLDGYLTWISQCTNEVSS